MYGDDGPIYELVPRGTAVNHSDVCWPICDLVMHVPASAVIWYQIKC